jgi:hypothetical protein
MSWRAVDVVEGVVEGWRWSIGRRHGAAGSGRQCAGRRGTGGTVRRARRGQRGAAPAARCGEHGAASPASPASTTRPARHDTAGAARHGRGVDVGRCAPGKSAHFELAAWVHRPPSVLKCLIGIVEGAVDVVEGVVDVTVVDGPPPRVGWIGPSVRRSARRGTASPVDMAPSTR